MEELTYKDLSDTELDALKDIYIASRVNSISDRSHLFWNITYGVKAYLMSQNSRYDPQPMTRLDLMVSGLPSR